MAPDRKAPAPLRIMVRMRPPLFSENRMVRWDLQTDLVQKCSFLEQHPAKWLPERGRARTIQFSGGRSAYKVVDDAS